MGYVMMGGRIANIELVPVVTEAGSGRNRNVSSDSSEGSDTSEEDGTSADSFEGFVGALESFDVTDCQCWSAEDKRWMLLIIRTAFGDLTSFNEHIIGILRRLQTESNLWPQAPCPTSWSASDGRGLLTELLGD